MRLINARAFKLESFIDERAAPPYAILSHTWSDREVLYSDMVKSTTRRKYLSNLQDDNLDWRKTHLACSQAVKDRINYVWIDTCCIDKTSSAELSEGINSMFRWYANSAVCYAYLSDTHRKVHRADNDDDGQAVPFEESRWFKRGWTLQELIAPSKVVFYSRNWCRLGEKRDLSQEINKATGIDTRILTGIMKLADFSIAMRMAWASDRSTSRIEDEAYSLLGIFDVNMPLLYGEGSKAFVRLQEEILRVTNDHSIFAWSGPERQLLAPSASHFRKAFTIDRVRHIDRTNYEMTKRGIRIALRLARRSALTGGAVLAILDCVDTEKPSHFLALRVRVEGKQEAGPTEVTLHSEHYLTWINGMSDVLPYMAIKTELLMLNNDDRMPPLKIIKPDPFPVQFCIDWEVSFYRIGRLSVDFHPLEEWQTAHRITTLRHPFSGLGIQCRVVHFHYHGPRVDGGDRHFLIGFGYCYRDTDQPGTFRPFLGTSTCSDDDFLQELQQTLSLSTSSRTLQNASYGERNHFVKDFASEKFFRAPQHMRRLESRHFASQVMARPTSVGIDGKGCAIIITEEQQNELDQADGNG